MSGLREFHIRKEIRDTLSFDEGLYSSRGTAVFANLQGARRFHRKLIEHLSDSGESLRAEDLYAMGLIDEAFHVVLFQYRKDISSNLMSRMYEYLSGEIGRNRLETTLEMFLTRFPTRSIYTRETNPTQYLNSMHDGETGTEIALEELFLLYLSNANPGYADGELLINDHDLNEHSSYSAIIQGIRNFLSKEAAYGPDAQDLFTMLRSPAKLFPQSLQQQLEYIRDRWGYLLGDLFMKLLRGIDFLKEVNSFFTNQGLQPGAGGFMDPYSFDGMEDYERFSDDSEWMPKVVLLAKSTLVWLSQLSSYYSRDINRLDQIPDEELDRIASRGFNALWLIGLWERSDASRKIKHQCGNPEAAASAYALYNSEIAGNVGGWDALKQLRDRCARRGIRLASDMVPNHTGIDSQWMQEHPDWYLQLDHPPYPSYSFTGENLSSRDGVGIYLEDHYYDQSDAAVVFKRIDFNTGHTRYIYHGNDGTHMPWNDTAQLNYLKEEVREAVIQTILHVARNFPIIRFDAAMTLAKKHIHRLWFPEPGSGGDIATRAEFGMTWSQFNELMPREFWRDVVDRVNREVPDTLLLAEAFWMMEGYFVRTLGMHRVYNSAFMNMLKNEENDKYRKTIKNTIEFDKDILKRFVNFMNNPDEDTAVAQFGDGDKYFGVCTMMVTMPGLPMFGHGQVEGFTEKYGMEYQRAYYDETPRDDLLRRHEQEIFPLMKKRYLFSGVEHFFLFDFKDHGNINDNVFAYSNANDLERALVFYNNAYGSSSGYINETSPYVEKSIGGRKETLQKTLGDALRLSRNEDSWCLFRESGSGLWYIRHSLDIHENGFHLHLNGYETRVYLDIHEVRDNEYGHYRQLHDRLQGEGVKDIGTAIRQILLKPVYDAFISVFSPDFVDKFVDYLGTSGKTAVSLHEQFVKSFTGFVKTVEEYTVDPDFTDNSIRTFSQVIHNIHRAFEIRSESSGNKAMAYLLGPVKENRELKKLLLGFIILHSIGDYDDEWMLEGRIHEVLGFAPDLQKTFSWLSSYSQWSGEGDAIAASDLKRALDYQVVLRAIGTNYFNGVHWFNRESFEDFAWWSAVYQIILSEGPDEELMKKSYTRSQKWLKAMEESGYELEKLKDLLPSPKSPKKTQKAKSSKPQKSSSDNGSKKAPNEASKKASKKGPKQTPQKTSKTDTGKSRKTSKGSGST
ncbi:alpha-amylase family glycosyl hydrolase [Salinispira pacifica]|uniref:Alpha-amylase family protein n=1 Tax=Salinispira pacifica TaxID=1307761 RepID=V5WCZ0_9SPIO|nr:alpha-amylase family glycosyl hydrolase [Salinispira pacifica]AHC13470.1 Alpha-amylase family protein [Salinispira pacifica]